MKIRLQALDTVLDEVEAVRRRVAERAVEMFRQRSGAIGDACPTLLISIVRRLFSAGP